MTASEDRNFERLEEEVARLGREQISIFEKMTWSFDFATFCGEVNRRLEALEAREPAPAAPVAAVPAPVEMNPTPAETMSATATTSDAMLTAEVEALVDV